MYAMMGYHSDSQRSLFCYDPNLDERIPVDHPLRAIRNHVDFDFVYAEVEDLYGYKGNVSVAPPVILKMMLLLVLYNVRSERELMKTIPFRLDWLWFLGYDLDSTVPNHSVLSKARTRWGTALFKTFFERIVWQCVEAGLVDGHKLFVDASLIEADASNNSVVRTGAVQGTIAQGYEVFAQRLDEPGEDPSTATDDTDTDHDDTHGRRPVNRAHRSTTDPDASITRQGRGSAKLCYKVHRAVDETREVITSVEVTPGAVNEAHRLAFLIDAHQATTELPVTTVVADTKYGTVDNYLACCDRHVRAHIPDIKTTQDATGHRQGIFPEAAFRYDPKTDTYRCPGNQVLRRRKHKKKKQAFEYAAGRATCCSCPLRSQCTTSPAGRTIKRHSRHDDLKYMRTHAQSAVSKKDIKQRQHLMERSFAQAVRYGFKRARWRRLWRVEIQEYLIAAVQNIMIFLRHVKEHCPAQEMLLSVLKQGLSWNQGSYSCFLGITMNESIPSVY
jgi:transposase